MPRNVGGIPGKRRGWSRLLSPHTRAPLTGLDFGGHGLANSGNYYTASFPQLPNADWSFVVWIRPTAGRITSGFWGIADQMGDTSTGPGFRLILNSGNSGFTFTSIRSTGGTEELLQSTVQYLNREMLIVTQRRGSNYEQYVVLEGESAGSPNTATVSGTTIPAATWRIGSDQFGFDASLVIGEVSLLLNDSLTAGEVTELAKGKRISEVASPDTELRFRSGAVSTETNLGSRGSAGDASRVGSGFWLRRELFKEAASGYSITAEATSYTVTGANAVLRASRRLSADATSFGFSGNATGLRQDKRLVADQAVYALTGNAATLRAARRVSADAAAFSVSSQSASLRTLRRVSAEAASFVVIANATTLRRGFTLSAAASTFSLSGQAAVLRATRTMAPEATSYSLNGFAAVLRAARRLLAQAVSYSWTGHEATLIYTPNGNTTMQAEPASYTFTGVAVAMRADRRLQAATAVWSSTGGAVVMRALRRVAATPGGYAWSASDASLQSARRLMASSAAVAWIVHDAALRIQRRMPASFGTYQWSGNVATLLYSGALPKVLLAQAASFAWATAAGTLVIERAVYAKPRQPAQVSRGAHTVSLGGNGTASVGADRPARLDSHGKRAMLRS